MQTQPTAHSSLRPRLRLSLPWAAALILISIATAVAGAVPGAAGRMAVLPKAWPSAAALVPAAVAVLMAATLAGLRAIDSSQVVFIMLVHETGVHHAVLWEFLELLGCRVVVHLKKSVRLKKDTPGAAFIRSHMVPRRYCVDAEWGQPSLVEAELRTVGYALKKFPKAACFYFTSGADIPLEGRRGLAELAEWGKAGRTMLPKMWEETDVRDFVKAFEQRGGALAKYAGFLTLHHQWVALDRLTAQFAVDSMKAILQGVAEIKQEVDGGSPAPSKSSHYGGTGSSSSSDSGTHTRSTRSSINSCSGGSNNTSGSGSLINNFFLSSGGSTDSAGSSNGSSRSRIANNLQHSSNGSSTSDSSSGRLLSTTGRPFTLSPDEYWLTVLAFLWYHNPPVPQRVRKLKSWEKPRPIADRQRRGQYAAQVEREKQQQQQQREEEEGLEEQERTDSWRRWRPWHIRDMTGTRVVFPPDAYQAQQLQQGLAAAGRAKRWCPQQAGICSLNITLQDGLQAWDNTQEATQWSEAHPVTFTSLQQLLLWAASEGFACGSLSSLLRQVAVSNDEYFLAPDKTRLKVCFVLRKVVFEDEEAKQELYQYILARLSIPPSAQ